MTEKFFSVDYSGRQDLFEGLFVWEKEEFRELQGTCPVISFSFANIKEKDYNTARRKICQILSNLYSQYNFICGGSILDNKEKDFFESVSADMDDVTATMAVHQLSLFLSRYYGKKVIILLDEYDTPVQEAYINGYWEEITGFMRSLLNATFKTNPYMERAILTGITRISRESIFSDLNNLKVITATSEKYADCFGFTEKEVFSALDEFGLSDRKEEVKEWYDGFTFGNRKDIYNPWSVLNYLDTQKVAAYWANSSANGLVEKLLREGGRSVKQDFEKLMKPENLTVEIDEAINYEQLSVKKNAIWSLLLSGGYLKVVKTEFQSDTGRWYYTLSLTNREVYGMFENMIREWFSDSEERHSDFNMEQIWEKLYHSAKSVLNPRKVSEIIEAGGVAAAIEASSGKIYTGVCIDTACTLGICAERNAIFNMITNGENAIRRVIAINWDGKAMAPCGACRELMTQLMPKEYKNIEVMLDYDNNRIVTLGELTPEWWI